MKISKTVICKKHKYSTTLISGKTNQFTLEHSNLSQEVTFQNYLRARWELPDQALVTLF